MSLKWEATRGHARLKWEAEVGGHARPKWEAEVGGCAEAEVGGRSERPKWEAT